MGYGMLILDVKGNFHIKVKEIASKCYRNVITIELGGKYHFLLLKKECHTYSPQIAEKDGRRHSRTRFETCYDQRN